MLEAQMEIRVGWGDCDPARMVYNPVFFDWMERGLLLLFQAAGLSPESLLADDPNHRGVPLVASTARFVSPARNGDFLILATRVGRIGRSSLDIMYRFTREAALIAEAEQTRVWTRADEADPDTIGPVPVPDPVKKRLSEDRVVVQRLVLATE